MDRYATLAAPAAAVFAHLADPARLGEWLPEVERTEAVPRSQDGIGCTFTVTVHTPGGDEVVETDVVAHEPPWLVGYRLLRADPVLIRATCTVHAAGTRVHVHQSDGAAPLAVDLARLAHALDCPCGQTGLS